MRILVGIKYTKNMKSKRIITIVVLLFVSLITGLVVFHNQATAPTAVDEELITNLRAGDTTFELLIADEPTERTQGLSGRENLEQNQAMLFIFDEPAKWGIWMKDMLFSIDILWLDEQKKVVHVEKNVAPETYPSIFEPSQDALYIVELNAGAVDRIGVSLGDTLQF